jgi:hypothetical protein
MPHFDTARTRWGVHWNMIGAQESLVEILLLEFPQFRLEFVLRVIVSHPSQTSAPHSPSTT